MRAGVSCFRLALLGVLLAVAMRGPAHAYTAPELLQSTVLSVDGTPHSFQLFVPEHEENAPPMPLVVLLHGAGGDGLGQIRAWQPVARANKCLLLAPNIDNTSKAWDALYENPVWIRYAIDEISRSYPVDKHRLYLWGYSAGGMFTFYFGFIESRYFAAASVHGGVIENYKYQMADLAVRKIPFAYYIGSWDPLYSTKQTRACRDVLLSRGFEVHYVELKGADHNFFARSGEITADAWKFLSQHRLDGEPSFDPLDRAKIKKALR
jgi:poly(3-hydroxybutyrate) depolymerase